MAGYVIHLAVAESYIKKHPSDIKNYDDFISGVIAPDGVTDKSITHYGEKSSKANLKNYLDKNEIEVDFDKGYFLHLVTDYLFYNKFLECFSKDIYNDYDILNKALQEKYEVKIPESVKDKVFYKSGETKILKLESTIDFIEMVSNYELTYIKKQVLDNNKHWLEFKKLPKI